MTTHAGEAALWTDRPWRSRTAEALDSFRASPEPYLVWLAWLAMMIVEVLFVARYAAHVPFWDDLELLRTWIATPQRTLGDLWGLHNEHRVPLPLAIQAGLLFLTNDFRSGMYFEIAIFALVSAAMILVVRRLRGRTSWTDAFFPLVWMHIGNAENLLMGFQISLALPTAIVCALLLFAASNPRRISTRMAIGFALALFALPLCGGPGLTQAPAYWLGAVALGTCILRGRVEGSRAAGWTLLAGAALTAGLIALYFVDFQYSPANQHTTEPRAIATVASSFLSLAFGQSGRQWWPWSILTVIGLVAAGAVSCVVIWKTIPAERVRASGLLLAMGGTLLLALGIGHGRGGTPTYEIMGFAVRYVGLPAPILCAAYIAATIYGGAILSAAVRGVCIAWMGAAIPLVEIPNGLWHGRTRQKDQAELRHLVSSGQMPAEVYALFGARTYPTKPGFCYLFRLLAEHSLDPFEGAPEKIRQQWMDGVMGRQPISFESPTGTEPSMGDIGDGYAGLIVPPGCVLHYAIEPGCQRIRGAFGEMPRKYIYGPVGGLRVLVVLKPDDGPEQMLLDRTLDPMNIESDRESQVLDLELPPHACGDLSLHMLPADPSLMPAWGYWARFTID
jgi:hypothetical protein